MTDLTDKAELEAKVAALEAKVARLEGIANRGFGVCTSEEASTGKGAGGTAQLAMDRMKQPKEIEEAMVKATAGMLGEIVRTARR
jgi:hypothetical protein